MLKLTPWELHSDIWVKRDDLFAQGGVNGSKFRQCLFLFDQRPKDAQLVVTGASALSPQHAIVSTCARIHNMQSHHVIACHDPAAYPSTRLAQRNGAIFHYVKVGYQPALTRAVRQLQLALNQPSFIIPYGITTDDVSKIQAFHEVGAYQVQNLPDVVHTLYVPAGSCNTLVSVLLGLQRQPKNLRRLISVAVGPSKVTWVQLRLSALGVTQLPFEWDHSLSLHDNGYAGYHDKMPETLGTIPLHPTYEGKIWRWLRTHDDLARLQDGHTGFWNVGTVVQA